MSRLLRGRPIAWVSTVAVLFLLSGVAWAQETTGALQGVVTDPSGAVVPGAEVESSGPALVRPMTVVTDDAGVYNFGALPPGTYQIKVSLSGFQTTVREGIEVQVGKVFKVDIALKVGDVSETVVVSGEAPIVDVSQSKTAINVTLQVFDHLPKGRSFDSLIALAPGARYETKGGGYQVDGASGSENVYVVDGVEVTNLQTGELPTNSRIPVEFLQEVQIKSSSFEAQYGGATGGVINTIVRSGGNDFHGEVALYAESDSLNAGPRPTLRLNPDDDAIAEYFHNTRDGYRRLNPGFALGGPIMKDKVWFFTSYFPDLRKTDRSVTFLSNGSTGAFERNERTDFFTGKVDFAPLEKLRARASYIYSPNKINGLLPTQQGTDSPTSPWDQLGSRRPGSQYSFGVDYVASSKLLASVTGGYSYRNYSDYGIPPGVYVRFLASNKSFPDIPTDLQRSSGVITTSNYQVKFDQQPRWNVNADGSYITNLAGQQHSFKFGYNVQHLSNKTQASYGDGYMRYYWGLNYTPVTSQGEGKPTKGTYGYYIDRDYGVTGNVGSDNMSIYFQDAWQVVPSLTLNLGLRTEREFLPAFQTDTAVYGAKAIQFGFGDKLAPRVGFAWNIMGQNKFVVKGHFGLFYDLMKYEMPRGSFGGDHWIDYVYTLDTYDWTSLSHTNRPGTFIEAVNWRIPSNDPNDNTIDPALKPMRERAYDFGFDYAAAPDLALNLRYTHKNMDRTIEDVGTLGSEGEKYYIANPGFGITADPNTWDPGFPVTPKAKRQYDAVEIRADKRFSKNYQFVASYTYSRLYGNYGGLASSDENGRVSPNVNRYFDLPFMSFDSHGQLVYGRLATDRPHTLKFFGAYVLKSKLGETNFAPSFYAFSGIPLTTEGQTVSSTPVYFNGRGDMGRTPFYSNWDFLVFHDFKIPSANERYSVRVEMNIFNLFNQATATNVTQNYIHPNDGHIAFENDADFFKGFDYKALMTAQELRVDPQYGKASAFQDPRTMRFGVHFKF